MKKNSIKMTRINQEIVKELAELIRSEVKDPRVGPLTSVTGADCAVDLKTCKVYISVLGGEDALTETLAGLKAAEGFLRRMLAKDLNLRNTPQLTFLPDRSIEYGMHISGILEQLNADTEGHTEDAGEQ